MDEFLKMALEPLNSVDLDNVPEVAEIFVQNPRLEEDDSGSYVTYEITLKTSDIVFSLKYSKVRRRFSEFVWLRKHLAKHHKFNPPPELPSSIYCGSKTSQRLLEYRRKKLQDFLRWCLGRRTYLSESAFHLFVQTAECVEQIEKVIQGESKLTALQTILSWGEGYRHHPQPRGRIRSRRALFDHTTSMMRDSVEESRPVCCCC